MSAEYETSHIYNNIEMNERQSEATQNEPHLETVSRGYEGFDSLYDDTVVEERQYEVLPKKSKKRWLMIAAFALLFAVCFGTGFAVGYSVVPSAGRLVCLGATESSIVYLEIIRHEKRQWHLLYRCIS